MEGTPISENKELIEKLSDLLGTKEAPKPVRATGALQFICVPGDQKVVRLPLDKDWPDRKRGVFTLLSTADFVRFVNEHSVPDYSRIFIQLPASMDSVQATAYLDFHGIQGGQPGWCQFVAQLNLGLDPDFVAWKKVMDTPLSQTEFASFIEDNARNVIEPSAAEIMNVALNLEGRVDAKFSAVRDLDRTDRKLHYEEATSTGDIEVPRELLICVPVFNRGVAQKMKVRLGFTASGGGVKFAMRSPELQALLRKAAFDTQVEIETGTKLPVFNGSVQAGSMEQPETESKVVSEAAMRPQLVATVAQPGNYR